MVAFVGGAGLGLFNTSGNVVGDAGMRGTALAGRSRERTYVNTSTGNLVVQRQDEYLAAAGADIAVLRTYNSQGLFTDDNADNWRMGVAKTLGNYVAGVSVTRTDGDGAVLVYAWDGSSYVNKQGDGAFDTLAFNGGTWSWTDGTTGSTETYDWNGASGKMVRSSDNNGNDTVYTYGGVNGSLVTSITSASGEVTCFDYFSGTANLQALRTVKSDGTIIRIGYQYTANRLTHVDVDITPADGSVSDGNKYSTDYYYDAGGRLTRIHQTDATDLSFTYEAASVAGATVYRVKTITQVVGAGQPDRVTTLSYDDVNRRTSVADAVGTTVFTADAAGQVTGIVDPQPAGGTTSSSASSTTFTYDQDGNVTRVVDARGNVTVHTYDSSGNRLTTKDAAGNYTERTYNGANRLLTETRYLVADPDGVGPLAASSPLTSRYAYDGNNNLRFAISADGRVTEYQYKDPRKLLTATIQYTGDLYTGTAVSESALVTWAAGLMDKSRATRVDNGYDFRGNLLTSTRYATLDATGTGVAATACVTTYLYDPSGQLLQTTSANGNQSAAIGDGTSYYLFDGLWRNYKSVDALGNVTLVDFQDAGGKTVTRAANNLVTTATYNAAGELLGVQQANGAAVIGTTTYWYDAAGRPRMTQDATGVRQHTLYDEAGRKILEIDGTGTVREYTYNASNQVVAQGTYLSALNPATLVDAAGNPANISIATVRAAVAAGGQATSWNLYDAAGRLVKSVDELGYITETQYDGLSRITQVTQYANKYTGAAISGSTPPSAVVPSSLDAANDRRTTFAYNADGQLTDRTDAQGYVVHNDYDAAGRLIHTVAYNPGDSSRDRHTWTLYDSQSRVSGTVDAEGFLTENTWDNSGNLKTQVRYASVARIPPQFITASTRLADLRPLNTAGRTTAWTYTDLNRLDSVTDPDGVTKYTWDAAGHLTRTDRAWGTTEQRSTQTQYDALGRVTAQISGEGGVTRFSYDAAGRRASMTDANGLKTLFYYDADGQLAYTINGYGEVSQNSYDARDLLAQTRSYGTRLAPTLLGTLTGGLVTSAIANAIAALANPSVDSIVAFGWDLRGRQASRTDALGYVSTTAYNAFGEVDSTVTRLDAASTVTTKYTYDRRGLRTATIEDAGGLNRVSAVSYDGGGRMSLYKLFQDDGSMTDYTTVYNAGDATRVDSITANRGSGPAITYNNYDRNGFIASVTTSGSANRANARTLANDVQGRVLQKVQIGSDLLAQHTTRTLIVNGEVIGSSSDSTAPVSDTFASNYTPISSETLAQGPSAYTVQAGDTLQSIAKSVWGDANLWYLIADANGTTTVTNGQVITIPGKTNTIANDYQTFTPYSQGKAVGDTTPILPAPKKKSNWLKQLIMAIIIVVATIYTAGALSAGLGSGFSTIMSAGAGVMTGGAAGGAIGTFVAGGMSTTALMGTAAAAAAVGSIAGQAFAVGTGMQDRMNWRGVGLSALTGGIGAGIGSLASTPGSVFAGMNPMARAAITNMASQGIGVVTGIQKSFDWKSVAASAAGAGVGQALSGPLGDAFGNVFKDSPNAAMFATRLTTGLAAGTAAAVMRGGKVAIQQVAVDSFGNALGNSLAEPLMPNPTRVMGAGRSFDAGNAGQGLRMTQAQVDGWAPSANVADPLTRYALDAYAGGTHDDEVAISTSVEDRRPYVVGRMLSPMAPVPRPTLPEPSARQYVVETVIEKMDGIRARLDAMGEDPSTSEGLRLAAAVARGPGAWIPDAVKFLAGVGGYALDSQLRGQVNTAVGNFLGNDPIGTTKYAATRYWDDHSLLEVGADTFNLVAGGSISAPFGKLGGLALRGSLATVGEAGETALRWTQKLSDYSLEFPAVRPQALYSFAGAVDPRPLIPTVRNLRAEAMALAPEGFEVTRISQGAAIMRYGDDFYSVPKGQYSLIPELRTMDTMGDVFTRRVQGIADNFDSSVNLTREQRLRLDVTPDGWLKNKFMSAYKGSWVHDEFAEELRYISGAADLRYMRVGPDVVGLDGAGLKYEITQFTPSLNAIYSHTKKYPSELLRYVTYR